MYLRFLINLTLIISCWGCRTVYVVGCKWSVVRIVANWVDGQVKGERKKVKGRRRRDARRKELMGLRKVKGKDIGQKV